MGVFGLSAVYIPVLVVVALVLPKGLSWRVVPGLVRGWGYLMLAVCCCRLEFSAEARAALDVRAGRVITANHSSSLDLFVGAAFMPEAGVPIAKREMLWVPFIGLGLWAIGSVFLDRGDPERSHASLNEAAARVKRDQLQVVIAPEGTRSQDGSLGRFKLGAFHLARQAEIPILPLVLHGCARLWPRNQRAPTPGVVRITMLPEMRPERHGLEEPGALADELRAAYAAALADPPTADP